MGGGQLGSPRGVSAVAAASTSATSTLRDLPRNGFTRRRRGGRPGHPADNLERELVKNKHIIAQARRMGLTQRQVVRYNRLARAWGESRHLLNSWRRAHPGLYAFWIRQQ